MTDDAAFNQMMQAYCRDMSQLALAPDAKALLRQTLIAEKPATRPCDLSAKCRSTDRLPLAVGRRRLVAALIAAALVLLTGFTVAARGQEYWRQWFGTEEAAGRVMAVGEKTDDQNVSVEVVSAANDFNHAYFLVQVTGLPEGTRGDRAELIAGLYVAGRPATVNDHLIGAISEDGTARFILTSMVPVSPGAEVAIELSEMRQERSASDVCVSEQPVSQLVGDSAGQYRERPKGARPEPGDIGSLGDMQAGNLFDPERGGLASIQDVLVGKNVDFTVTPNGSASVVGLDIREGVLHVLIEQSGADPLGAVRPYLADPQRGDLLQPEYGISYFYGEDVGRDDASSDSWPNPARVCTDYAFYPFDEGKLNRMQLWVDGETSDWRIDGEWSLTFAMPSSVPFESRDASTEVECEGFGQVRHVTVSPFSIGFDVSSVDEEYWKHQPQVQIVLEDGSTMDYAGSFNSMTWKSESALEAGEVTISAIGFVEDYESIAALIINGTRVNLM